VTLCVAGKDFSSSSSDSSDFSFAAADTSTDASVEHSLKDLRFKLTSHRIGQSLALLDSPEICLNHQLKKNQKHKATNSEE